MKQYFYFGDEKPMTIVRNTGHRDGFEGLPKKTLNPDYTEVMSGAAITAYNKAYEEGQFNRQQSETQLTKQTMKD